jgi:membrane protease YdiL (CAAX protease family)
MTAGWIVLACAAGLAAWAPVGQPPGPAPALGRYLPLLVAAGLGIAAWQGSLNPPAALPIVLLTWTAYVAKRDRHAGMRWGAHALFIVLAAGLALHLFPGFGNIRVYGPAALTPTAAPFTMYLNFDKPLIGFWVVLACAWVRTDGRGGRPTAGAILCAGLGYAVATAAVCVGLALAAGLVAWEPKWPALGPLWAVNNFLMVAFAEEALFRGYVQGGLLRIFAGRRWAEPVALAVAALLFGAAHAAGGWPWIVAATVAGIGYGLAYRAAGLRAAILAHFGLNLIQFALFTYPMLARPAWAS